MFNHQIDELFVRAPRGCNKKNRKLRVITMSLKNIFILVALFGVALADNAEIYDFILHPQSGVHELNVSTLFDEALPSVRNYITQNGFDPMDAPDMETPLFASPLLKRKIYLNHGQVKQLSTIYRKGDVMLRWTKKKASLYVNVAFATMDVRHEYSFKWLLIQRKGVCQGRFHGVVAEIILDFDFKSRKLTIRSAKLTAFSKFELTVEGRLGNLILKIVRNALTTKFRADVLKIIEAKAYEEMQKKVDEINANKSFDLEETIMEIIAGQEPNKP